jgi:hypothetical protein
MLTALFGLVGVAIGGLTSFATSWLIQRAQLRNKHLEAKRSKREKLFGEFITEAARLYGDALSHEKDEVADMVKLYALVAQMRLVSSATVVAAAEKTMDVIAETYLAPNRSLREMRSFAQQGGLNFLVEFSQACRTELAETEWPH